MAIHLKLFDYDNENLCVAEYGHSTFWNMFLLNVR